jgi:signal transduction histidine kinase
VTRFKVLRTSSFRQAVLYAGLTGVCFLVLFGVIFLSTTQFMRHQIDDSINSEIDEILTGTQGLDEMHTQAFIQDLIRHSKGFSYLLQDHDGRLLAGNLSAMKPVPGVIESRAREHAAPDTDLRGKGVQFGDNYLFVAWSTHQLHEMEEFVIGAFLWGLAASLVLALAGGLIMSGRLLRRVQSISETGLKIVAGDLSQRLLVSNRGDEFDNLSVSVNAMLDRIQSLLLDLRQVTNDIAHDMRTPLSHLRQALERGQQLVEDPRATRAVLTKSISEIDTILGIFAALLRIAQMEAGSGLARAQAVDVSALMGRAAELYQWTAEEKQQRLVLQLEPEVLARGDGELLMQLFVNLIENAIVHCPPGATITLTSRGGRSAAQAIVADDGPGIAPDLREKVLQRFFRLESSRSTPGSGLGLSLAAAIVKLHEAQLELSDAAPGLRVAVQFRPC